MKKIGIIFVSLLIGFVVTVSCTTDKKNEDVIKIGAILPLTGPAAIYGKYAMDGQKRAVEELNKINKKKIIVVFEDGKGDPKESINVYKKLREKRINIITTTLSPVCLALKPLAEKDNVLFFGDASHPNITNPKSKFTFRHSNVASQEVNLIISKMQKEDKGPIALISINDEFGKSFTELFEKQLKSTPLKQLAFKDLYDPKSANLDLLVEKANEYKPNVLLISSLGPSMGNLVKKFKLRNPSLKIYTTIGFVITGADKIAGKDTSGVKYVTFDFNEKSKNIPLFESLEYGTIMLLGNAIEKAGGNPKNIAEYMSNKKQFIISNEIITLNSNNDLLPNLKISTFK